MGFGSDTGMQIPYLTDAQMDKLNSYSVGNSDAKLLPKLNTHNGVVSRLQKGDNIKIMENGVLKDIIIKDKQIGYIRFGVSTDEKKIPIYLELDGTLGDGSYRYYPDTISPSINQLVADRNGLGFYCKYNPLSFGGKRNLKNTKSKKRKSNKRRTSVKCRNLTLSKKK